MCIAILRGQFGRTPTALGLLQNELIIWILFKTIFTNYLVDTRYGGNLEKIEYYETLRIIFVLTSIYNFFLSEISVKRPITPCPKLIVIEEK